MSGLDVEALLDSTASSKEQTAKVTANGDSSQNGSPGGRHSRDRDRDRGRDTSRDRDRERDRRHRDRSAGRRRNSSSDAGKDTPRSEAGSHKSRRRSRSRDSGRHSRRHRGGDGDYYRGSNRSRSRSPHRYYRPRGDDRRDRDDRSYRRRDDDRGPRSGARNSTPRDATPPALTEDERDRRTVFVQQLAARLRTRELKEFFEKVGPVAEAQIVKDRVSNRSKGVGYVEFKNEESVTAALQLTGQKLLGIPVIVQLTEAEKNRQVRNTESSGHHPNSIPFHRLYVGNIHFSITEQDLQNVFEPFGELEFVQLQKDDNGRSRGYGFVQFRDAGQAREALEKMNGFDLAGRPIRVGLGNDKFTPESTANLLQRFQGQNQQFQGSAFSGAGGRGPQTSNFDRAGGRDNEKGTGASALDDTDVAGVNFNNYSRDALMRKLARTDEPTTGPVERQILKPKTETKPLPINVNMASRCVVLHNMFDPAEEEGEDWVKELEDDVREEAERKYGHVVHISLDPNSQGDIYLKFDKVQGGENAIKGLNGRYFGGRMISAAPVVDAVYSSLFSRTKAI
ncbi:linker between RRM2 and RRM3 domains in RBM39 protein-domain-containing protein [Podospora aff. communis PSN243]|uniref:Linker between RRM2 and RRM3 domains in RBM39 protein-domain-containing protein n=1 Tax=Podospora aff. communis PSN243 TaxID=3040156 RepID=A0AAV9GXJ3_9PEZI|nr:linker between RRM2 and RRM3 domains in RBM39 protein-domain-containing protein [Podospora aff. communis PSN243]